MRLYIHIELQSQVETEFPQRVFIYHYRLYDRYGPLVMSVAVLGDSQADWRPQSYQYDRFGCELTFKFPIIKLLDYQHRQAKLENSTNPFAYVVRVHLAGLATRRNTKKRLVEKVKLYQVLCEANYSHQDIFELFRFLDWLLVLPEPLTLQFHQFVQHYEEANQVRYVTSIERLGIQQGLAQGFQQGSLQEAREAVMRVLKVRFSRQVSKPLVKQIEQLEVREQLSKLLEVAAVVTSIAEFERQFRKRQRCSQ